MPDSTIVGIIMVGMIVIAIAAAYIATKKGNSGFTSSVLYKKEKKKENE